MTFLLKSKDFCYQHPLKSDMLSVIKRNLISAKKEMSRRFFIELFFYAEMSRRVVAFQIQFLGKIVEKKNFRKKISLKQIRASLCHQKVNSFSRIRSLMDIKLYSPQEMFAKYLLTY